MSGRKIIEGLREAVYTSTTPKQWNDWTGGQMPVQGSDKVNLKFRSGNEAVGVKAKDYSWEHYESQHGGGGHIVAWCKHLLN